MFKIGDFARINKVTIKTLRHYDSLGLLRPDKIDSFTGYRFYTADQIPRLNRILALKEIGFTLDEIMGILNSSLSADELEVRLEIKRLEIVAHIRNEQAKLERLKFLIKLCEQEDFVMKYDVVIKKVEPIKIASVRDTIPNYGEQGHLWEELVGYINKHDVKIIPPCMVIYYEEGYTEGSVDAEIIESIVGDMPETDRIKVKTLPAVDEMACLVHTGPYTTLPMAYGAISKYIQDNGYEVIAPPRELYLKGGWITDDPNEYVTELQFPVRRRE
ncbi:MAG: transcription activator effector binding protein [Clostridia bacterium]|nr:transcription activator effector binding protein [Clostridia bacterium]